MMRPGASQVLSFDLHGKNRWELGRLGHISDLQWSFTYPGGPEQLTCTLSRDSRWRHAAIQRGRVIQVRRGCTKAWEGFLTEPQPTSGGWNLLANGAGTYGNGYRAMYEQWKNNPDEAIAMAISRGLRWQFDGSGNLPGMYLGQRVDNGAQSITELLDLVCSKGGLGWHLEVRPRGNVLKILPLPTTVNRILFSASPPAPTASGDVDRVFLRYQTIPIYTFPGGKLAQSTYTHTTVGNPNIPDDRAATEAFADLSAAGPMPEDQARGVGALALKRFQPISYDGPFTLGWGDLMTMGGVASDLGCEHAGWVAQVMTSEPSYTGKPDAGPLKITCGHYVYNDTTCQAEATPMGSLRTDFGTLLGLAAPARGRRPDRHPGPL